MDPACRPSVRRMDTGGPVEQTGAAEKSARTARRVDQGLAMATTPNTENAASYLRVTFLLSYIAGAAVIGASVVAPVELPLLIGVPNAVMLLYLLSFVFVRRKAHLVEPFADSLFYLGFLFTVTSLVAALLPYAMEVAVPSVEAVLAQFAVALTTTLFGLIGRVVLRQFAISVDRAEAEAQASLFDRTQAFNDQLDGVIARFQETADRLNADLERTVIASVEGVETAGQAGIQELRETAAAARDSITQSTAAVTEQMDRQIQHAFRNSAVSVDGLSESMLALKERTTSAMEPLSNEMRGLTADLRSVREAAMRNEERITRIFESYDMMMAKLREAQEVGDRFQELIGTRISGVVTALEGASRTVDSLSSEQRAALGGLAQEVDGIKEARASLAADVTTLSDLQSKLGEVLNAAIDQTTAASRLAAEEAPLSIDEEAFSPLRPAPDEEVYIPPLRGRHSRNRG